MNVYLGYDTVTKQYLKSLAGAGGSGSNSSSGVDMSGFTMSGDIDMDSNEIVGLDDPSNDSSALALLASTRYLRVDVPLLAAGTVIHNLRSVKII